MPLSKNWLAQPAAASTVLSPLVFAGGLAALTYAGICLALYSYQTKLIFRPLPTFIRTPADIGLGYEDVWIPLTGAADSTPTAGKLHAWWIPAPGSQKTLLFCHGNYGNISYNTERIRFYHSLGFSILAFDYRGYGQSLTAENSPAPTESSTYADAEAAWQYLINTRQLKPNDITVYGHSMGGAIAIELATRYPQVARLIIESSFTTMKDAVDAKKMYRLFPVEQLLAHPFDSLSKVKTLKTPVLYVHGDQDFDVPMQFSKTLYAATPNPKQLWIAPDADHNGICSAQGDTYAAVVNDFCKTAQLTAAQPTAQPQSVQATS